MGRDTERRRSVRRRPRRDEPLSRVRLRTGRDLAVVDVSGIGVLVEGSVRLLPGTHVDVHVMTQGGRLLVRCRVVRCHVAALAADAVWYLGALAFDRPIDTGPAGYLVPSGIDAVPETRGGPYPGNGGTLSTPDNQGLAAPAVGPCAV